MRAIDGDALRERLQNLAYDDWNQGITISFADACGEIIEVIEEQPTIEPERKTGQWIRWYETKEDETGTEYIPHCRCSECGTEYDPHSSKVISFCNVCGAKLEEGAQE